MCGIFCLLSFCPSSNIEDHYKEFKLFEKSIQRRGPDTLKTEHCSLHNCNILLAASVLWLQGKGITEQPLKTDNFLFIYNGDVFGGIISDDVRINEGDTKPLFEILNNSDIQLVLENIEGPYAFIYLSILQNKLYFGRDIYGRRSLLIGKTDEEKVVITSVAKRGTKFNFMELPSIGTFYIDLETKNFHLFPWKTKNKNFENKLQELELFLNEKVIIECCEHIEQNKFVFPNESQLQFVKEIEQCKENEILDFLSNNLLWLQKITKLKLLLENSLKKRLSAQPLFCQNCFKRYECDHSIFGILFSGGVDCAVLTLLADKFVDGKYPIDLINVAFDSASDYKTPDRLTAKSTLSELKHLCPQRKWNFVEVNVPKHELDLCRSDHISDLIYPLKSVLDDSLGCALWFASRATTDNYTSPCRVLLVGMGADELFGGYTRHRAAFQKNGWKGLHEVLEEDWQNLSHRNLARDDRVVSDHGRQLRTPYLDEELVEYVRSLNSWEKSIPSKKLPKGLGDKIVLRSLAHYLGLKDAAKLTKRALQFGSRIANSKEKGHEISQRL